MPSVVPTCDTSCWVAPAIPRSRLGTELATDDAIAGWAAPTPIPDRVRASTTTAVVGSSATRANTTIDSESEALILSGRYLEVFEEIAAVKEACYEGGATAHLKVILETGGYPSIDAVSAAARLAIDHGADFVKTSTGKTAASASPEAARAMLVEIRRSNRPVGLKPSGGIRSLGDAATYLAIADEEMGVQWATPRTFRFGASGLLDALEAAFAADVERLRALEGEAIRLDPAAAGLPVFRDPERLAEAEDFVARAIVQREPLPGPRAGYRLHDLVRTARNRMAIQAAAAVIESPGTRYNPLVIHGRPGSGKTHLAHAIGNALRARDEQALSVACIEAGDFIEELIDALQLGTVERWRARYRTADVLIVDGVEAFAGKERTQEEFFHLFNVLQQAGRQLILTVDRPPAQLHGLQPRLRSRFEGARRSPFDEAECGHHYARAMASWAAVLAHSGFGYSGITGALAFAGASRPQQLFWSNGAAWGTCAQTPTAGGIAVELEVLHGQLRVAQISLSGVGTLALDSPRVLGAGERLAVTVARGAES